MKIALIVFVQAIGMVFSRFPCFVFLAVLPVLLAKALPYGFSTLSWDEVIFGFAFVSMAGIGISCFLVDTDNTKE